MSPSNGGRDISSPVERAEVVVVGAGAAGLMAAIFAARTGADTLLLERTKDGGRKILISGGGRCNVLPGTFRPDEYVTDSSRNSLRKILRSWPLEDQRPLSARPARPSREGRCDRRS